MLETPTMSLDNKRARGRGRYGETRLAKKWGGVVCGRSKAIKLPSGKFIQIDCQRPCDVIDGQGFFAFESKWLKSAPKMLEKVMLQAIRNCPSGLVPVGVIGDREARTVYYILTEKDMLDLHKGGKVEASSNQQKA